ncbi:MAG: appr-1-p processing domain-containing protein [Candidatus Dadabacteria bacterium CSP1-2]|nr:MAG: appr-1-p processing domain-containing protein [Candidatus Dadabacteria bacterium CSP1-2]
MDLKDKIIVTQGDITDIEVDAIVNAANTRLLLGSGVAGAIRRKGGDSIQKECDKIGSIPLGEAVVTGAGKLKAKFVIHAAGMHLGRSVCEESLREATNNSLLRADEKGVKTVALPAIGTGVGGFPLNRCAQVMIDIVVEYLKNEKTGIEKVYFVLFDMETYKVFNDYLRKVAL